ncbi:DUF433 domain-containing protein [Micromonospora sp. LOL_023]|uniref:DUF433 domain-containing protein n=1 Tax=Micromonospora sp. LOL_023 TaxID=3345418 RepID=UPI003A852B33
MSDIRFTEGILNFTQAARHLRVPQQTFHRWAKGYLRGGPLLHIADSASSPLPVTFIALADHGLIVGGTNQHVIREIVADHMQYIAFGGDGYPERLQLSAWLPPKVEVDVRRAFGQPIFAGTGTRVADVAGMIKAGESAETVADEFGLSISDVRTSARILLGVAA